ncbi:alpha/beta hydrolase [Lachnospiraceae bacterium ZAX-1]
MSRIVRNLMKNHWEKIKVEDDKRKSTQPLPKGVSENTNIDYVGDGNPMHLVDVFYPEGTMGVLPVVVDIHGGGWMYGDKELNKYFCMSLAKEGFAVVCMNYRLLPETDLKGQIQDIFTCFHWLGQHGNAYHCDTSQAFLTGDSAGGHLAGLSTCINLNPALQGIYEVFPTKWNIKALAINHGVAELNAAILDNGLPGKEYAKMLFGDHPKKSPWYGHASFSETAKDVTLPPILLITSEADDLYKYSILLKEYLEHKNISFEYIFWAKDQGENLGHVFNVLYPEWLESQKTNAQILSFFLRIAKKN